MKIEETFIVYYEIFTQYVKIHKCVDPHTFNSKYYMELNSGEIRTITGVEFVDLLNQQ